MPRKAPLRLAALAAAFACLAAASSVAQSVRTTAEGVYSAEQAERGRALYAENCASCHGDRLQGGQGAGPLSGPSFNEGWTGQPALGMFHVISTQMPPGGGGRVSSGDSADIMAYILAQNGHPAGPGDLPDYTEGLMGLTLAAPPAR